MTLKLQLFSLDSLYTILKIVTASFIWELMCIFHPCAGTLSDK